MPTTKPTKPDIEFLPNGFGTADDVVKNNFSNSKILNGFSSSVEDVFQGDNLNYTLDTIGKQLKYLTTVVDYINSISINNIPYIDANNQLNAGNIHTFLPSQTGNAGKFLTTNGANQLSWAENVTDIGDPIFTLNFNKTLPENYVWLEGAVKPTTGDWANLFAIYGWQYDTSYTDSANFRLPNFLNRSIWGGTSAGYIEASLPNHTHSANVDSAGGHTHTRGTMNITGSITVNQNGIPSGSGAFSVVKGSGPVHWTGTTSDATDAINFNASRSWTGSTSQAGTHTHSLSVGSSVYSGNVSNGNTVQPPVIKVRVYTRYK